MDGELRDIIHYPFFRPVPAERTADGAAWRGVGPPIFWQCRAAVVGDPFRRKTFWYLVADPAYPNRWSAGHKAHPLADPDFNPAAAEYVRAALFRWPSLRWELARGASELILWTEGEKDALRAADAWRVPTTSHHGGAGQSTAEQAAAFAPLATVRGRRSGTTVLIGMDRDDAGASCALGRWRLLRSVGLRPNQLTIVRPADGVLAGGGGCGAGVICECPTPCPPPGKAWRGADVADHVNAGLPMSQLVPVAPGALEPAAERTALRQQQGWAYGDAETAAAIAENRRRNGGRFILKTNAIKQKRGA